MYTSAPQMISSQVVSGVTSTPFTQQRSIISGASPTQFITQPTSAPQIISSQVISGAPSTQLVTQPSQYITAAPQYITGGTTTITAAAQPTQIITAGAALPTQYVTTVAPAPVTSAAPQEVLVETRIISREEMVERGILIQAGSAQPIQFLGSAPPGDPSNPDRYLAVLEGQAEPPVYQSHHFDSTKWNSVNPRDDDIIIATAYKSGTTWMQQICAEILFQGQEKPATVGDMSPWVDLRVPPAEVLGPMIEGQNFRRFLKTHLPADAFLPYFNQTAKYIYVARDGLDAYMSLMNHYEKGNDMWYGAMNEAPGREGPPLPRWSEVAPAEQLFDRWLTEGWPQHPDETDGWPFWSYFKNVKSWWSLARVFNQPNILFVHFNNMKTDLDGQMRMIAEFLGVPIDEAGWQACVQACTFDEMQKNADVVAPLNGALWEGGGKSFIFKGTNERWRGVLQPAQVAAYEQKALAELGEECARFMATGQF